MTLKSAGTITIISINKIKYTPFFFSILIVSDAQKMAGRIVSDMQLHRTVQSVPGKDKFRGVMRGEPEDPVQNRVLLPGLRCPKIIPERHPCLEKTGPVARSFWCY